MRVKVKVEVDAILNLCVKIGLIPSRMPKKIYT